MSATNLHLAWARLLLRGLATAGVKDVVISPGSRSTPLVIAASEEKAVTCHTIIDERSAAFFALGQVRATRAPTVLICTSGTAGAHYLPAIIEAGESFLPLIALTADRPWEAYDVASPQTIDQVKLFGDHVRAFFDVGVPGVAALRAVPRIAAQAVARSLEPTPGPVHINAHFRKPLEPVVVEGREPWQDTVDRLMAQGTPRFHAAPRGLDSQAVKELAKACVAAKRGIIACGPSTGGADNLRLAAGALSIATGFPLFAEATSQVRFGVSANGVALCGGFDALLRSRWAEAPDLIIELGSTPISSAYGSFVERHAQVPRWVIAQHGWHDPFNSAAHVVQAAPDAFAFETATWVTAADDARSSAWARRWTNAEAVVWNEVERDWSEAGLTEAAIPGLLTRALPEHAWLCVGNSGPVRDLDTYAPPRGRALRVLHQRGASGIDGLVSAAAGVRSVVKEPVALFLGDVSLLHDLGGLAVARQAQAPLVIVVVQNDGGRIFEQLPIGQASKELVSAHFVTPHGLSFEHAARMFGVAYRRCATPVELEHALTGAVDHPGCTLIEAVVPPPDGNARRRRLWKDVAARLEGAVT
jgi:2-succinyl-5-enolpyruvyl-6-hydroxy-3-cyclohexene-1-carboxylate synthase